MCDKSVDNYPHALKFDPNCYMTQKMCDKAVNTYRSIIEFVLDCDRICSKDPFLIAYCPD